MSDQSLSLRELEAVLDAIAENPDTQQYERLSSITLSRAEAASLHGHDPFGPDYRRECELLYGRLSGRTQYEPSRDELSGLDSSSDIWRSASPYNFGSSRFVAEFLASWAAIFAALDVGGSDSVLEYGPGSGQALLMLARTGIKAFGVDIDPASLDQVKRQAEAMRLDVKLERAEFGRGFEGEKFDRILFFEAFHHALNFDELLLALHDRLEPNGRIVLCGEPVVDNNQPSVPFPWGPRLDALSIYCMRRYGWMELGFQRDFLTEIFLRTGWSLEFRPSSVFRANTYIAQPTGDRIAVGSNIMLPDGWGAPETTHRWTTSERSRLPLPNRLRGRSTVVLKLANYLPTRKSVTVRAGQHSKSVNIISGEIAVVQLGPLSDDFVTIETSLTPATPDPRLLGIAVLDCELR